VSRKKKKVFIEESEIVDIGENLGISATDIWAPQEGPQLFATICPVRMILFGGSRGGGKSDCAIGKQVYGALRYGHNWNGLFIRKSYKYFADIRRRLLQLIRMGLPAELVGPAQGTNYLRFKNGANVTLTVVESIDKAEFFQGQSFCVAEDTEIRMADGTGRPIQDISVGEYVSTFEGPRLVTFVMQKRLDDCVSAVTELGEQIHPLHHPIFSNDGWQSYSSVLGSGSRGVEQSNLVFSELESVTVSAILVPQEQGQVSCCMETATLSHALLVFYQRLKLKIQKFLQNRFSLQSQTVRNQGLFESQAGFSREQSCASLACVLVDGHCGEQVQGSRCDCQFYCGCNGGRVHYHRVPAQEILPSRGGVAERFRGFLKRLLDALGNTRRHSQSYLSMYVHPYSGEMREVVVQNRLSACVMTPIGKRFVYDLTVDRANHYISHKTGLVNKNTQVSIEEACQFSYIDSMIEMLKGCLRSAAGVPTSMFLTANPGGPGHSQVKARFMPKGNKPGQVIKDGSGMDMVFIPSRVEDNKVLCDNDPEYVNLLRSIKDPMLRRAWLEGDWDVVLGGFFGDVWNHFRHVVPRFKPPEHWPVLVSMDWGSATPFSINWFAISDGQTSIAACGNRVFPRGAMIMFFEWYGCPRGEANVGLRMASDSVALRILELERRHGLLGRTANVDRVADPSIFAEKDGPSIAEKMAEAGVVWRRAENKRISGWDSLRTALRGRLVNREKAVITNEEGVEEEIVTSEIWEPMLYFTDNCDASIRTLPEQERDSTDWEDIDTTGEDHAVDSIRYAVTSRPHTGVSVEECLGDAILTGCALDIEEAVNGSRRDDMKDGLSTPVSCGTGVWDSYLAATRVDRAK